MNILLLGGRRIAIVLAAILMATPITLIKYGTTGIVPADLLVCLGAVVFLGRIASIAGVLVIASVAFGLLSIFSSSGASLDNIAYSVGSLVFFIKPCFAFFSALQLVKGENDRELFLAAFICTWVFVLLAIGYSIAFDYGFIFRAESELQGNLLGIPLFGSYGVNSLACFMAICSFVALYPFVLKQSVTQKITMLLVFVGCSILTLLSLSREAIIGLLVMGMCFLYLKGRGVNGLVVLFVVATLVWPFVLEHPFLEAKIEQIRFGVEERDLDHLSSGRLTLYSAALKDIVDDPLRGVAFGGFGSNQRLSGFDDVKGLTPHNMFITAIWKGGVFFGFFYLLFVFHVVRDSLTRSNGPQFYWLVSLQIGCIGVMSSLWDILIVPNLGALFFFLCGSFVKTKGKIVQ